MRPSSTTNMGARLFASAAERKTRSTVGTTHARRMEGVSRRFDLRLDGAQWKLDHEGRAPTLTILDPDPAMMRLDDLLRDVEAESQPSNSGRRQTLEAIEEATLL